MAERSFRLMIERLQTPVFAANTEGEVLAESRAWAGVRKMLGEQAAGLTDLVRRAAGSNREQVWKVAGMTLVAAPAGEDQILVQVQEESIENLRSQLEDTVKINTSYQETLSSFGTYDCIATADSMVRIFTRAKQVAAYPTTILLLGETGVGKEVVTSFIHRNSDRADKAFIKINCSAIPEPLMEAELFGYEKGAFTGAREKGKVGLFELANHGTILLDEIGDMSGSLQAKLLRTIQENEIMRIGGTKPIKLDVRIISATSRNIEQMVAEGSFLDALYYRLNVVELEIPPLRERREDIIPLAEYFLQHFCEKYKLVREFDPEVRSRFLQYDWPGNVRELRNTVENLTISAVGARIMLADLPARIAGMQQVEKKSCVPGRGVSLKTAVENLQREMITETLARERSVRKAAVALDMDATTLGRLIKKLQIKTKNN